jgi:hypothetical protein
VILALTELDADLLVLTQVTDGRHVFKLAADLKDIGLEHIARSVRAPHQQQVLFASRSPLQDEGLLPVPGCTEAAVTNWLHRRIPAFDIEVVGFRAPTCLSDAARQGYWRQFEWIARASRHRHIVFVGDARLESSGHMRSCAAAAFQNLSAEGFGLAQPSGTTSATGTLDVALGCAAVTMAATRYVYEAGRFKRGTTTRGAPAAYSLLSLQLTPAPNRSATGRAADSPVTA